MRRRILEGRWATVVDRPARRPRPPGRRVPARSSLGWRGWTTVTSKSGREVSDALLQGPLLFTPVVDERRRANRFTGTIAAKLFRSGRNPPTRSTFSQGDRVSECCRAGCRWCLSDYASCVKCAAREGKKGKRVTSKFPGPESKAGAGGRARRIETGRQFTPLKWRCPIADDSCVDRTVQSPRAGALASGAEKSEDGSRRGPARRRKARLGFKGAEVEELEKRSRPYISLPFGRHPLPVTTVTITESPLLAAANDPFGGHFSRPGGIGNWKRQYLVPQFRNGRSQECRWDNELNVRWPNASATPGLACRAVVREPGVASLGASTGW